MYFWLSQNTAMEISKELTVVLQELGRKLRKVYGIREKDRITFSKNADFISDILKDFSNISYNLAIADHVVSDVEKDFLIHALKIIFFPRNNYNRKFLSSIDQQITKFESEEPEIDSPIYMILKAKQYDRNHNKDYANSIREAIILYAEALTLIDGFESVREFAVLETFKTWIEKGQKK